MKVHKEGHFIIAIIFLFLALLNGGLYYFLFCNFFFYFVLLLSIIFFCCVLNFFKSPHCIYTGETQDIVIAPADGKIVVIEEVFEPEYFQEQRLQISVFMGITNVHVNWVPVEGKVIRYYHQKGRHQAAFLPKSSTENERSTIVIERNTGEKILVRQIAGAIAKRITTYVKEGEECHINEQLGFIKFGSRVDIFLPLNVEVAVKLDQKVWGNQTVIAQLKKTANPKC
jgi:phosphatidylserine decarboxylase